MSTFQLHSQLAETVRTAASVRHELTTSGRGVLGRLMLQLRLAYLASCIDALTWRLRQR